MRSIRTASILSVFLFQLCSIASAVDGTNFTPIDPPRREYSTIEYQKTDIQPNLAKSSRNSLDNTEKKSFRFVNGRQLVGKIVLSLDNDDISESFVRDTRVQLETDGREILLNGALTPTGELEFNARGIYTSSITLILPNGQSEIISPETIQVQSISLGGDTRIMLIGDSITHGKFADDLIGYRHMLFDRLDGDGRNIDFVGDFGDPPYEGHFQGGEKINDFYPRNLSTFATGDMDVTNPMNQYRPNIVAVHLGTNDLNGDGGRQIAPYGQGSDFYETQTGEMATLINYLLKWHNGDYGTELDHILVSLIIPIKYRDSLSVEFNLEVARLINDFRNGEITGQPEPVILIDHFSRFREWPGLTDNYYKALMFDSLHPNNAGHDLMADTYYDAFTAILSGQPKWFTDITWYADVAGRDIGFNGDFAVFENQGVAIADFNNDGIDDIYTSRTNSDNPDAHEFLYSTTVDLPYSDVTDDYSVADPGGSRGVLFVDIDNDGDFDIFNGVSDARNRLFRNDGGQFSDITTNAGISNVSRVTTGVTAADFDGDGDLDLYAVNSREKNELYINDGAGYFQQVDRGADDTNEPSIPSLSASAADFDNDGDIDIYIVKRDGPNALFVNDGSGYFTENAADVGLALNTTSNGAVWADLDNDADLDLLVASTSSDQTNFLHAFENNNGVFSDRTTSLSIDMSGYSPIVADFDNDGDLDILATQERDYAYFYRNDGDWNFTQRNNTGAEVHAGDIRGAAAFDYDVDGDLDLFAARADMFNVMLQNNLSSSNNFIKIELNGPHGDKGGLGAKISLFEAGHLNDSNFLLSYSEALAANGHISQSSPTQHFGLGARTECDILVQFIDGSYMVKRNAAANQTIQLSPSQNGTAGEPVLIALESGDNQQGTVGEDLTSPLIVKVTDAQGRGVPDINVTFSVASGDAHLFLPATSSENISLEMESGQHSGEMKRVVDESASGGAFVMNIVDGGANSSSLLEKEILSSGDFYLWVRAANVGSLQELSVQIDGHTTSTASIPPTTTWQWFQVESQALILTADVHEFQLSFSSNSLQVDKLLLLLNPDYTPSGLEDSESQTTGTDASGLARRFVKLGEQAGPVAVQAELIYNGDLLPDSPITFQLESVPGPVAALAKISGDGQSGQPDIPLNEPFVVTVSDALGNPTPNETVEFTILSGGGSLTQTSATTSNSGEAHTTLTPGESASLQQVQAKVLNSTASPVIFQANITGVARELKYVSGNNQSGIVKSILPAPVKVRVLAEDSQPAVNFTVVFSTPDDDGLVSSSTVFSNADGSITATTDAQGYAQVWWQLGQYSGGQQLVVNGGSLIGSPLTVAATASPGQPAYLQYVSGDNQTTSIQNKFAQPLQAKLRDIYGNGTPGQSIKFIVQNNFGHFNAAVEKLVTTDAAGAASAEFTAGTRAGKDILFASAIAIVNNDTISGSPVNFNGTIAPGSAAYAQKAGGDEQSSVVDTDLAQPFKIRILDAYNNPVSDVPITFQVIQGNGSLDRSARLETTTGDDGIAAALYHVGTTVGEHLVHASIANVTPTQHEFVVHALPGEPHRLVYVSGNDQQGAINAALPEPFIVGVEDQFGNGVPNIQVEWQKTSALGDFSGSNTFTSQTNSFGQAQAVFTLGAEMGDSLYSAEASCDYQGASLIGTPISFIASARVGDATTLTALSPTSNITGAANHELQEPIQVRVSDENGIPVAGFQVDFQILAGGGRFAENGAMSLSSQTDASGVAKARWILGAVGQQQSMRCVAILDNQHLENSPIFFNATSQETQPQTLVAVSGDGQSANENSVLQNPIVVKVLDEFNEPYAGQPVIFSITKGDGIFVESNNAGYLAHSGSEGTALAHVRLGADVGENAYEISVQSFSSSGLELQGSPLIFNASGTAKRLRIVSGDQQSGVVNTLLPAALKVQMTDETETGIEGVEIQFSLINGSGEFTSTTNPQTNENGVARVQFKLGQTSGKIIVKAAAPEIDIETLFSLKALPDAPAVLKLLSGDEQTGVAGHVLNRDIRVAIVDQFENGVGEQNIEFAPQSGHGVILPSSSVESDSTGIAQVQWQLGTVAGEQYLFVSSEALMSQPLHVTATALANQAPQIVVEDSFSVRENENLSFNIETTDAENDTIKIEIPNLPDGALYNSGTKIFTWRPTFDQAGGYSLIIQAEDHIGARRMKIVAITVEDNNRPPVISAEESQPQNRQIGRVEMQSHVDFLVVAADPDNDALNYLWKVNNEPVSASNQFRLQAQLLSLGTATVEALVFDHSDTARTMWTLEIITAIKLAFFKADFEAYKGAVLSWKTEQEWGNLGFYVQRALRKEGPFEPISPLIESHNSGSYTYIDESTEAGNAYFYRLQDVQKDGLTHEHDAVTLTPFAPKDFALHQNFPNPFNPSTTIRFDIAEPAHVTLIVYDVLGRRVKSIINRELDPGFHSAQWDGLNDAKKQAASGVYYAVLEADGHRFVQKMLLLR